MVDPSRFMPTIRLMRPGPSTTWVAMSAQNACRHIDDHAEFGTIISKERYDRFRTGKGTGCSLRARSVRHASASSRICWCHAGCTSSMPTPTWSTCSSASACIRPTGPSNSPRGCGNRCSPTRPCAQTSARTTTTRHHTDRRSATTAYIACLDPNGAATVVSQKDRVFCRSLRHRPRSDRAEF